MATAKDPRVVRPSWLWFVLLDGGIVLLSLLALRGPAYNKARDVVGEALPPREALQVLLFGTAAVHAGEALVAGRLARRRGLPARPWRRQTFFVGFPSLLALRRASKSAAVAQPAAASAAA